MSEEHKKEPNGKRPNTIITSIYPLLHVQKRSGPFGEPAYQSGLFKKLPKTPIC